MSEPITSVEAAVRELGALPVPVGSEPRTLELVKNELTGANLALYEEELENARLRLAWKSASVWRSELRSSLQFTEASRKRWRTACLEAERERDELKARVAELEAERAAWRRTVHHLAGEAGLIPKSVDGEHYASTHHDYRVGRDLPELGGAR